MTDATAATDADRELMREQAARLHLDVPDQVRAEILADALGSAPDERPPTRTGDDRGHRADDDHNALLAVYDEPRVESGHGTLVGITVALKDNIAVADLEMTCGSGAYSVVPSFDATVVERLLEEGAGVVGKANMEPFAMGPTGEFSDFGHVENPLDAALVAGGSSSGSGAAVAAGTVDVALGTDTGGSVRIPAACCGIVGVKPSHTLVPRYGFVDFAPSLDTIGPLARDVETAATVLEAIAGPDRRDPTTSGAREAGTLTDGLDDADGLRVGLPSTPLSRATDAVAGAVRAVATRLEAVGVEVVDVPLDLAEMETAYLTVGSAEFVWLLEQDGVVRGHGSGYNEELRAAFRAARERGLGEHVARRILPPAFLDARSAGRTYARARREGIAFEERLDETFSTVDALVMPTLRDGVPAVGETTTRADFLPIIGNTAPFNIAGTPAVTLPVAERSGVPVSAQVVAPRFEDGVALRVARALERVATSTA
ncbi:amidase [Salinigranum halophilum]|uniref:amidase n=1 Tax=Salinigranum halophilum TaxID=2565931 RepID=UPI00191C2978|nr:amidase family protein [Salinigranum halophilum]